MRPALIYTETLLPRKVLSYAERQSWKSELRLVRWLKVLAVEPADRSSVLEKERASYHRLLDVRKCTLVDRCGVRASVSVRQHSCLLRMWNTDRESLLDTRPLTLHNTGSSQLSHLLSGTSQESKDFISMEPPLISHLGGWRGGVEGKVLAVPA